MVSESGELSIHNLGVRGGRKRAGNWGSGKRGGGGVERREWGVVGQSRGWMGGGGRGGGR